MFKCPQLFQDYFIDIPDPRCEIIWTDHDDMMDTVYKALQKWSHIEETDENTYEYIPDRFIQKKICGKLRYLAKLCQVRICDIMKQLQDDRR
jgi:hypothetical protein